MFNLKFITKFKILVLSLLCAFLLTHGGYAQADNSFYLKAVNAARAGDMDSVFMNLRLFLSSEPKPKLAEKALFSIGEYYFLKNDYFDAADTFLKFIRQYPQSKARIFALAYLTEIYTREKNTEASKALEKEIITSKQTILLFSESKEYKYTSVLGKKYKAAYFIDKAELYIDESLFATISF